MSIYLDREAALAALDTIKDPCILACGIDVSICEMGLIGDVHVDEHAHVHLDITFTEAGCMFTHRIITQIEDVLKAAGASGTTVTPKWLPIWTEERMAPRAREAFKAVRSRYPTMLKASAIQASHSPMEQPAA